MLICLLFIFGEACSELQPIDRDDLDAFPSLNQCFDYHRQASSFYDFAEFKFEYRLSPWIDWRSIMDEAGHVKICWDLLIMAHQYDDERIDRLHNLKMRIGYANYYRGIMPMPRTCNEWFVE